ncbi:hypothetical protein ATN24_18500 [Clostridium butyricum]|uniref:DUF1097 domain-containing protein n=3 Tax=Clostridium butyricum TaxID=1492 RepID=UPI00071E9F7C|nr:DUF1097 domain-containing protein [Clostridium butyricum]ALR90437.1 hypothetical protein ATN24_18500 [Clostridium butyricum]ALS18680.1 hypothetical protein ATD26_17465 [Clostridium butyricum]ANF15860.1 hypothetical protein AZ909_17485 [Clostridium butyricum]MCI3010012.1 DUF1097 domain-containing protein [Clostridium butyricum]NVO93619.1 DUF1097 domain-containing protein [Clostridium butyricum]
MLFKADEIIIDIMERKMTEKIKNAMPLAISIGLLPPLWAVVSSWVGIEFGWVALACGGIYVAAGDDVKNGPGITLGFLLGCIWGYIANKCMQITGINQNLLVFLVLCIMGFVCVILAMTVFEKAVYLPAWLGSWAVALGIFGQTPQADMLENFIKLLIAMLAGVWYIGAFNNYFQKFLRNRGNKND